MKTNNSLFEGGNQESNKLKMDINNILDTDNLPFENE
jgi:hypothetical protein